MAVDVLFPYYGDVSLMKLAVHSVLAQSYQDFRLVVTDDCYPDDTLPAWFASLGDDRIEYHRNETNLGANGNYRKAVGMATADLSVVMGADDIMLTNHLAWLVEEADAHPEAACFQPGVFVIDERGATTSSLIEKIKDVRRPHGHGVRILRGEDLATSLLAGNWLYFPSLGWRTEVLQRIGFRQGLDVVQDLALVLDIAKEGGALLLDDRATFLYRRHAGSDSSWRALDGTRFDEEHRFFSQMADEFTALGWTKAARTARWHVTSRLHALSLAPRAATAKRWTGVRNLTRHAVRP